MRIGTWNVLYAFNDRLDALRKVLASNNADLWILTETHDDLAPPSCNNVVHSENRPKNWSGIRPGSRWVSIWSKYPIEKVCLESSDTERTVIGLVDLGRAGKLLVYGTVLPWKDDRQISGWSEHHRVIPLQCAEWLELRKRYPDIPLCVAGDFNTDMGTGSRYGTKLGIATLRNGLSECDAFCSTEPSRFPEGMLEIRPIDHIALPLTWESKTAVVAAWPADKPNLSDHSGMVVEVTI